jgi:Protein of unknown function (DUF2630)
MDDANVHDRIEKLVAEEHTLWQRGAEEGGLSPDEHARLEMVRVSLDQCWDLLRQRRARREAGQDPRAAQARDARTVESYQQ